MGLLSRGKPLNKIELRPVGRRNDLVGQIVEQFKENLINGQLLPGDQIPPEPVLCTQLGVSRTAVREAMRTLAALGIVEVKRGNGTFISTPSEMATEFLSLAFMLVPKSRTHLLELRRVIEQACGQLVVEHATDEDVGKLSRQIEDFAGAVESKVPAQELRALDIEFHDLLFDATHNPIFCRLGKAIMTAFASAMQQALTDSRGYVAALEDHRDFRDAIVRRSIEDFWAVVDRSLETWNAYLTAQGTD